MHCQQAELKEIVDAPVEQAAELITSALCRLGWQMKPGNERLRYVSAADKRTDHIGRDVWRFDYQALVKWRENANGIELNVNVAEKANQWTQEECAKRCREIVDAIAEDALELKEAASTEIPSTTYGSAKWASEADLAEAGYLTNGSHPIRFVLGPTADNKLINVPATETVMHGIVCGPTGSGKTSSIFVPNLIERTGVSSIVTEATAGKEPPDLFKKTSGFRKLAGHHVYKFNPDDMTSHRINPLQHIKSYDQASQVASLIIQNTSSRFSFGDQIWENSERHLLTTLVLHAVAEEMHLGAIRRWLRTGPNGLRSILLESPVPEARAEYEGFYSSSTDGFRNGVVSGLMQRLNLWVSPRIVALTRATDFDVDELSSQLFTFYLSLPAQKTQLRPLAALVFNFLLDLALERNFKYPLALFLDEFTNYGYIPGIAEKLTIIRHRAIPAVLGIQDYVQLRKAYGDEDATLLFGQPGTKIFFRPRDSNTARRISEGLGMRTVVQRRVTASGHVQQHEFGRPLMNQGEVMALPRGEAIVFTPSTHPVLLKAFNWERYREAIAYPAPGYRKLVVDEQLVRDCQEARTKPEWQEKEKKASGQASNSSSVKTEEEPKIDRDRSREGAKEVAMNKQPSSKERERTEAAPISEQYRPTLDDLEKTPDF
jgi:type IV secretion system protein VirD4